MYIDITHITCVYTHRLIMCAVAAVMNMLSACWTLAGTILDALYLILAARACCVNADRTFACPDLSVCTRGFVRII